MSEIPIDCRASRGRTETFPPSLSPLLFSPTQFFVPTKLARHLIFFEK